MEKLLPTNERLKFVPESYIHPPEVRPGNFEFSVFRDVPVIDLFELGHNRAELVNKIVKAGQDFGIFFLINHGISEDLIRDMLNLARGFHELPIDERAKMCSDDKTRPCRLYSSIDYEHENVHYWRNTLVHNECQPNAELNNNLFPENPTTLREQAAVFLIELRKVFTQLVDMICEGLGINAGHWSDLLMERQKLAMNYYPTCPDPSLVLGMPPHDDTNPLTILVEQSVYPGYQILRNGKWVSLIPPPNSLIVNFGYSWEVISNGKIKGDVHRVVLDDKYTRVTIAGSIHPADNSVVEPAEELIDESNASRYTPGLYKDLHRIRKAICRDGKGSLYKTDGGLIICTKKMHLKNI